MQATQIQAICDRAAAGEKKAALARENAELRGKLYTIYWRRSSQLYCRIRRAQHCQTAQEMSGRRVA